MPRKRQLGGEPEGSGWAAPETSGRPAGELAAGGDGGASGPHGVGGKLAAAAMVGGTPGGAGDSPRRQPKPAAGSASSRKRASRLRRTKDRTAASCRKRTSRFAGCTFTSTSAGSQSKKRKAGG